MNICRRRWILGVLFFTSLWAQAETPLGELWLQWHSVNEGSLTVQVQDSSMGLSQVYPADSTGLLHLTLPPDQYQLVIQSKSHHQTLSVKIVENEKTYLNIMWQDQQFAFDLIPPEISESIATSTETWILVKGKITHQAEGRPLEGVKVYVQGSESSATSNLNGQFQIQVPDQQNKAHLYFRHPQYESTDQEVHLSDKKTLSLEVQMSGKGMNLEELVVLAPQNQGSVEELLELRKNLSQVADVMGAEQISKSGDSDAAASLRRVTGLTLVDGKYVYVRGLGERYSNVLLNGMALPSPEPSRRVIPLDLVPASVLKSLVVQKTYSADRTAEFGGGSILLQTQQFPEKRTLIVEVGSRFSSLGDRFLTYKGGGRDTWGTDDGTRALPKGFLDGVGTTEDYQQLKNIHNVKKDTPQTVPNFKLTLGNTFKPDSPFKFGALGSVLYSQGADFKETKKNEYEGSYDLPAPKYSQRVQVSEKSYDTGLFLNLGGQYKKSHLLNTQILWVRNTTDDVDLTEGGHSEGLDHRIQDTELIWKERELKTWILSGEHKILSWNKSIFEWKLSRSQARFYEPDRRYYRYYSEGSGPLEFYSLKETDGYARQFSDMNEQVRDVMGQIHIPFSIWLNQKARLSLGTEALIRTRKSDVRRFSLEAIGDPAASGVNPQSSPEDVIGGCLGTCLKYREDTRATDNYSADQNLVAYFTQLDLPLVPKWNLQLGARTEQSTQQVSTFQINTAEDERIQSQLKTDDVLPSVSLTYDFWAHHKLRWAYSETVSRPDFRELSNSLWKDDEEDLDVRGNPELKSATIQNMDLRWEWYPSLDESVSFGAFYKKFHNPIETTIVTVPDLQLTYANANEATNFGLELELRQSLRSMGSHLKNWTVSGNASWIDSQVDLRNVNTNITSKQRPLQGQSPWIFNLMLEHEWKSQKIQTALVYNSFGKRISRVGTDNRPDQYEQPFHQVDLVVSKQWDQVKLKFKAKNILDSSVEKVEQDKVVSSQKKGQEFSISLSTKI